MTDQLSRKLTDSPIKFEVYHAPGEELVGLDPFHNECPEVTGWYCSCRDILTGTSLGPFETKLEAAVALIRWGMQQVEKEGFVELKPGLYAFTKEQGIMDTDPAVVQKIMDKLTRRAACEWEEFLASDEGYALTTVALDVETNKGKDPIEIGRVDPPRRA